ncbi:MAG: hypothetical protein HXY22_13635 [Alphaproteobacteria bacterium]|nr:hypothetical protein [Alphaproteobacteria bacterium]
MLARRILLTGAAAASLLIIGAILYEALTLSGLLPVAENLVRELQGELYRGLGAAVGELKTGNDATLGFFTLVGGSFLYGVFHALGPGHGKAVISAYLAASGDTVRRGVILSMLSALTQGLTAIAIITVLVFIVGMTARAATEDAAILEQASYVMLIGIGLWLLWREAQGMLREMGYASLPAEPEPHHPAQHHHAHVHHHHETHEQHGHAHDDHGDTTGDCGHDHGAEARLAAQPLNWGTLSALVLTVGLRPCMGAIFVLVLTMTHGLYLAGVTSVLAMSLGTGITVASLAALTALARGPALKRFFGRATWFDGLHRAVSIAGGLLLVLLGVALLTAPAVSPFGPAPLS